MSTIPGYLSMQSAKKSRRSVSEPHPAYGVLFTLPVIMLELLFLFVPIGETFFYSLTQWNGMSSTWVGIGTFISLVKDPTFWRVMINNGALLLSVPVAILIPLIIAFLLTQKVVGWRFFRSIYFLPTAVSWVVIGMVAVRFFNPMLSGNTTALVAVLITFVWSVFGTNTIIFVTGMATLDQSLYEAARIDGANSWQLVWFITIPLIKRFIQFAFVTTLITAFTALFSLIFVMTGGGPGYSTTTLEFFIYQEAFGTGNFGFAATLGVVLFIVVFSISIIQMRVLGTDS